MFLLATLKSITSKLGLSALEDMIISHRSDGLTHIWGVKFPNGEVVEVSNSELGNYNEKIGQNEYGDILEWRKLSESNWKQSRVLTPFKDDYLQIIEIAYLKSKHRETITKAQDKTGINGDSPMVSLKVLTGKDPKLLTSGGSQMNLKGENISDLARRIPISADIVAIKALLLKENGFKKKLDEIADNPDKFIAVASTNNKPLFKKGLHYWDQKRNLVAGHAFSVKSVDKNSQSVYLTNPWNTWKVEKVSYQEFSDWFKGISYVEL